MNEKISVIIPTKNRTQDVIRCLQSISIQTVLPDEVVIVDSSGTAELKYELYVFHNLNINYIHTTNSGLTYQRNIGIKASSGDTIVFSDDDLIWDKNYLKEIMRVFYEYPVEKIGGVTGNIIWKKRMKNFLAFGLHVFAIIFFLPRYGSGCFQVSGMPTITRKDVDKITKCEFLYGGSMSFRKEVIGEFMLDERLPGYSWGEDDDIAYRVSRKYQNFYTPYAKVVHNGSVSTRGSKYDAMKTVIENHHYLFKKNFPQDFKHKFAFWWSVAGLFILEGFKVVVSGDGSGVRGLARGLSTLVNKKV
jgi:GT2 family glycosyltransferase